MLMARVPGVDGRGPPVVMHGECALGSGARSSGDLGPAAAQPATGEAQSGFVWTVPPGLQPGC